MKQIILFIGFIAVLVSCGKLSDEERKKLREGMEKNKIVKVSDEQIVAMGLDEGRRIYAALENGKFTKQTIDSLIAAEGLRISYIKPGDKNAEVVEQQLIEAYIAGIVTGNTQDNIQKLYLADDPSSYDYLVYSKPVVKPMPDGVENLEGVWNIYLTKKNVVIKASKP